MNKTLNIDLMANYQDYSLFYEFIKTYEPTGFNGVDSDSLLMLEMEQMMERNNQFFVITDVIQLKFLYTSKRSNEMIGVAPKDITPYHFFEATHPDDLERLSLGRTKLFKRAQDFFISKEGNSLASTNFMLLKD